MTLCDFFKIFETECFENKTIKSVFVDENVDIVNQNSNIDYECIVLTLHTRTRNENTRLNTYNFTMFYLDQMTDWRNKSEIHCNADIVITDIINRVRHNINFNEDESFTNNSIAVNETLTFFEGSSHFLDELHGAYLTFSVTLDNEVGDCYFKDSELCLSNP